MIRTNKLLIVRGMAFNQIETPFGKNHKTIGGSASYINLSAAMFHAPSTVISVVGDDYPSTFIDVLSQRHIDTSGIEVVAGGKTFFWSDKYHNDINLRDTLDTQLNVLADFCSVMSTQLADAEVVMLGDLHPCMQMKMLDQMSTPPKLVMMDTMNYWMTHTHKELLEVIARIDVLTISDEEACQLTGEYALVKAAERIMAIGVKYVIIKKGEHGALLFHADKISSAPALPLAEVFDPTGTGDVFAGGIVGYLAKIGDYSFESLKNALMRGSNLASFCIEKFGTERMLSLTEDEIYERLQDFKDLTQFDIVVRN